MLVILIGISMEIVFKRTKYHGSLGTSITKERQSLVCLLFQIAETHDVACILNRVQDAVCTTVRLYQTMISQVLVHPERIKSSGVKACQEHVHDDKDVNLAILHTERNIFIIVREFVG